MAGRGSPHVPLSGLALGLVVFASLWLLSVRYRHSYVPRQDDVTVLADGLLLLPGAKWTDWFTRGDTYFFDVYPEWPWRVTPFSRPVFQLAIYLGHFLLGKHWESYLALNYGGVAAVAAVAFGIARTALCLSRPASVLSAILVLLSPAVLASSLTDLSLASESLASALVGCGFLAVLARRDWLCAALLMIALLTKETAAWAPFAAAATVLLRPEREGRPRRLLAAVLVLAPVVFWLGLRLAFYGGIGGSYATAYWPLAGFLRLTLWKLTHLDHLFVMQEIPATEGRWAPADLVFRIGAAVLVFLLLIPWALMGLRSAIGRETARERRWPAADGALLVTLWAGMGLGFHFALALSNPSYASAAVVFAWPAVVAEVARRGPMLRLGLAACSVLSLAQMSHFLGVSTQLWGQGSTASIFDAVRAMNAALSQIPTEIKQVYVLSAGGLVPANPDYIRALLGENAEIIRVADVEWNCSDAAEHVVFNHDSIGGVVTLDAVVPKCGRFFFAVPQIGASALVDGQIRRNAWFSYELPEARLEERAEPTDLSLEPGRRLIAHVRTRGPARFIIERGRADGGIAWFDTP